MRAEAVVVQMEGFGRPLACCLALQLGLEVGDQLKESSSRSLREEG